MKVLSLFDGISCGMLALQKAGVEIETYYASEIDETALAISKQNFPQIIQLGDVRNIDFEALPEVDLLIGGSPCQNLSMMNITNGVEGLQGEKSCLFWYYAQALKILKPKYFLFENVRTMPPRDKEIITEILGVKPISINSALFVAQQRNRLYWTNIPVAALPEEEANINFIDIMEKTVDEKYYIEKPFILNGENDAIRATVQMKNLKVHKQVHNINGKINCLLVANSWDKVKKVYLEDENRIRKITPLEAERLQGLPDGYTKGFLDSKRYMAIGNVWTIDVIAHILKGIKENED